MTDSRTKGVDPTSWQLITKAAAGDQDSRDVFAQLYLHGVRDQLRLRWQGTPLLEQVEDATSEVFVECYRAEGALWRSTNFEIRSFRRYLHGLVRNVARRFEAQHANNREVQASVNDDPTHQPSLVTSIWRRMDRATARQLLQSAKDRHAEVAAARGPAHQRRFELLRLRFEQGMSIKEIAVEWEQDAALVHQEYRQARVEYRRALDSVLSEFGQGDRQEVIEVLLQMLRGN